MKNKIVKRNKEKMTFWIKNPFIYLVVHRNKETMQESKYMHKYKKTYDTNNASRMNSNSERIMCPILISSKVRRSRVKNKLHAYRSFRNIEQLNEECGTNLKIEEISQRWL